MDDMNKSNQNTSTSSNAHQYSQQQSKMTDVGTDPADQRELSANGTADGSGNGISFMPPSAPPAQHVDQPGVQYAYPIDGNHPVAYIPSNVQQQQQQQQPPSYGYTAMNPMSPPLTSTNYHAQPHQQRQQYQQVNPQTGQVEPERTPKWTIVGFCFSWIPIVGLLTYCLNWNAPRGSQRKKWANRALMVAVIVSLLNLFVFR